MSYIFVKCSYINIEILEGHTPFGKIENIYDKQKQN